MASKQIWAIQRVLRPESLQCLSRANCQILIGQFKIHKWQQPKKILILMQILVILLMWNLQDSRNNQIRNLKLLEAQARKTSKRFNAPRITLGIKSKQLLPKISRLKSNKALIKLNCEIAKANLCAFTIWISVWVRCHSPRADQQQLDP